MLELIITSNSQRQRLDIKDTEITLTKLFSDLSDPAAITCGYSMGVTLPATQHNNAVLGRLWGVDASISQTFDQRKKCEFTLLNDGGILYRGNMVLDSIHNGTDGAYYSVTLYDKRQDIFNKLDYTLGEPAASADGTTAAKVNINALSIDVSPAYVKADWMGQSPAADTIDANGDLVTLSGKEHSIMGTLPTCRKWDNFDTSLASYDPVLETVGRIIAPTGAPTQYEPHQRMQWHVWMLKPYIYIKALWEFMAAEIKRVTGYRVVFDGSYFNLANPYYTRLIRTCHYLTQEGLWHEINTTTSTGRVSPLYEDSTAAAATDWYSSTLGNAIRTTGVDVTKATRLRISYALTPLFLQVGNLLTQYLDLDYRGYFAGTVNVKCNGSVIATQAVYIQNEYNTDKHGITEVDGVYNGLILTSGRQFSKNTDTAAPYTSSLDTLSYSLDANNNVTPVPIQVIAGEVTVNIPANTITSGQALEVELAGAFANNYVYTGGYSIDGVRFDWATLTATLEERRAYPVATYTSLLGEDFNLLTEFTNLLKTFGLLALPDYDAKTITIETKGEYFFGWRSKMVNWSDRVHFEEGLESTGVLAEMAGIAYTYDTNDSLLNAAAYAATGYANHSIVADLGYENNTEDKPYLEGLQNSDIVKVTDYYTTDCLNSSTPTIAQRSAVPWLYYDNDTSGEALEERVGQLLFRGDNVAAADFTQYGHTLYPCVCSDSDYEDTNDVVVAHNYTNDLADFAGISSLPVPLYTLGARGAEWSVGLYADWLQRWDRVIYHKDNRQVKCKVFIKRSEFAQYDFNQPIIIDNNIYLCTAIDEYALNNETASVTLLRLGDASQLDGLIPDFYDNDYLRVSGSPMTCHSGTNTFTLQVVATKAWTLAAATRPSWLSALTFSPTSGTAGSTSVTVTATSTSSAAQSAVTAATVTMTTSNGALTESAKIANAPAAPIWSDVLSVTPATQLVPNRNGDTVISTITVTSRTRWKYTVGSGTVVTVVSGGATVPANTYTTALTLTITATSRAGTAGDTQAITFTNESGSSATFRWVRAEAHNVVISPTPQHFNYCTVTDQQGYLDEIPFTLRADFNFVIDRWDGTMRDGTTSEYPFDVATGYPLLYCYNDGQTYSYTAGFQGNKNTTYRMAWRVPRRYTAPNALSRFFWRLTCQNNDYYIDVDIFCDTLNNVR